MNYISDCKGVLHTPGMGGSRAYAIRPYRKKSTDLTHHQIFTVYLWEMGAAD
jgi:hypothetical protein